MDDTTSTGSENETDPAEEIKDTEREFNYKSKIWEYFEVVDKELRLARCKLCYLKFSYKTDLASLWKHYKAHNINSGNKSEMISKLQEASDEEGEEQTIEEITYLEEEVEEEDVSFDKRKILRNGAWEYFEVSDEDQKIATCTLCREQLSYRTTSTNLTKHLQRRHFIEFEKVDEEGNPLAKDNSYDKNETSADKKAPRTSAAWEYFTVADESRRVATCKLCEAQCSFNSSVSNLMKHVRRKHLLNENEEELVEEEDDETSASGKKVVRTSAAWEYFTVVDESRRVAACKLCDTQISFNSSVSNLMKHVQRKHRGEPAVEDDECFIPEQFRKNRSSVWLYYKCVDNVGKFALCLICQKRLSCSSLTNLKRHLKRTHPGIKLSGSNNTNKMIISSDGQLYEIEEATKVEQTEDDEEPEQTDPMEVNTIYLNDYEDEVIEKKRKRKPKPSPRKRSYDNMSIDNSTSEDEVTFQKKFVRKKDDSIEQFGKYLVSLLKQLPKELSNQLQADFVKQVMTSQLEYEAQKVVVGPSNGYAITITEARLEGETCVAPEGGNS